MKILNSPFNVLLIIAVISVVAFVGGRHSNSSDASGSNTHEDISSGDSKWTCSMHPQIQQVDPGLCPICAMDLIPVESGGDDSENVRVLELSDSAKALAEIKTDLVKREFPEAEIRLVGRIDYDETRLKSLTARFPARIDKLFVNYTGITVKPKDHLAEIYSPDLLIAQKELLTAIKYDPSGAPAESSREKLRLWDLLPEQIEEVERNGRAQNHMELRAPVGGVVVEKHVREGDYVKTGQSLFKIADLSHLWIYLDAYESDLSWLRYGQKVNFTVEAYPGEIFNGLVIFIDPILNTKTRTVKVRVDVNNEDGRLKPGMFVKAVIYSKVSSGGKVFSAEYAGKWISPMHPEIIRDEPGPCPVCGMDLVPVEEVGYIQSEDGVAPLIIPRSAVLRTGKRAVVYVQNSDNEFEGREISLGLRAGDYFIVNEGLDEGDRVVTNGAFKIDSALQIQARPSMMNSDSSISEDDAEGDKLEEEIISYKVSDEFKVKVDELLKHYFGIQKGLAADDAKVASDQAGLFVKVLSEFKHSDMEHDAHMAFMELNGPLANHAVGISTASTIKLMREEYFEGLSMAVKKLIQSFGMSGKLSVYEMHCSMALEEGAAWLQDSDKLLNPYYGASMLRCGTIEGEIK